MAVRLPVTKVHRIFDRATGRMKFSMVAYLDNFNDNNPYVRAGDLKIMLGLGTPVLTNLTVSWDSTSAGAGLTMYADLWTTNVNSAPLGQILSTTALKDVETFALWVPIPELESTPDATYLLYFSFSGPGGGHANDKLRLLMTFECFPEPRQTTLPDPLPVSLEGYRWPLIRRRD